MESERYRLMASGDSCKRRMKNSFEEQVEEQEASAQLHQVLWLMGDKYNTTT